MKAFCTCLGFEPASRVIKYCQEPIEMSSKLIALAIRYRADAQPRFNKWDIETIATDPNYSLVHGSFWL